MSLDGTPEAAHCATEIGNDDCIPHRASDVLIAIAMVVAASVIALILAAIFQ